MVPITKGERLRELPQFAVRADSGEYSDVDLILCGDAVDTKAPDVVYQAQFVRYGNIVYQFETPEALGAAIVALEEKSTHDAAQLWREDEERRIKRSGGKLAPENPSEAADAVVVEEESKGTMKERVERKIREELESVEADDVLREAVEEDALGGGGGLVESPAGEPLPVIDFSEPAVDISTTTPE